MENAGKSDDPLPILPTGEQPPPAPKLCCECMTQDRTAAGPIAKCDYSDHRTAAREQRILRDDPQILPTRNRFMTDIVIVLKPCPENSPNNSGLL